MKKAQDLSLQVIIIAALSLVVLVILIIIFNTQITGNSKRYNDIGNNAEGEIKGEKCSSFLAVRKCAAEEPTDNYYWSNIGKRDCKSGDCWERGGLKENK